MPPLHRSVRTTAPKKVAAGAVPETNMGQRHARDHEVQENKSFDWSGPGSEKPTEVVSDGSANIAEIRDDHAVDQIDGDVF